MDKVIGVGWHKTGTCTLKRCLKRFGYSCAGFGGKWMAPGCRPKAQAALAVAERKEGFVNFPWNILYRELDQAFPGSKFILTVRQNSDRWWQSIQNHFSRPRAGLRRAMVNIYGAAEPAREVAVAAYEAHNAAVRDYFAGRPQDIVELCFETGDGWEALCGFLGERAPRIPFPHIHKDPS